MKKLKLLAILLSLTLGISSARADVDTDAARALLEEGRGAEAYERLAGSEFARSGEADFDYVFGLAALASGRAAVATLAFERVIAVDPGFAAAHLDMGRAYYALGDLERTEQAFAVARSLNPPPDALATMANYEKAIAARRDPSRLRMTGYVEVATGRDTNVNQATSASSVNIPAFGGSYTLGNASLAQRDGYSAVTAGGEAQLQVTENTALYAGGELQVRDYLRQNGYDIGSVDGKAGLMFAEGKNLFRFGGGYNDYRLESNRYRGVASALGEWRHAIDEHTVASFSAQYNEIRYVTADQRGNDVNVVMLGAGLSRAFQTARPLTAFTGAFAGMEREERERTDGNRALGGVRIGASVAALETLDVFASLAAQVGLYSRYNTLFLVRRREAQYDLGMGANWRFAPLWSVRPQVTVTRNDSNLPIYDTMRYDVSLNLRRDFR
jgi:tetratricopeptide (TPR) repeat protein